MWRLYFIFTSEQITKLNKTGNTKCWWGPGACGIIKHCWCPCKLLQACRTTIWQPLPTKFETCISYNLAIPEMHVVVHQKKLQGGHTSSIHNSWELETAQISIKSRTNWTNRGIFIQWITLEQWELRHYSCSQWHGWFLQTMLSERCNKRTYTVWFQLHKA